MIGYDHFSFSVPTQAIFGWGTVTRTGELLVERQVQKVLVVTDNGVKQAGLLDKVLHSLHNGGIDTAVFDEVEPDPSVDTIYAALAMAQKENVQGLVAVGGGSSIDTAKGVSVLFTNGGDFRRFEGINKIPVAGLCLMAIPTTAGTGSEVTVFAVISDHENERKFTVGSRYLAPDIAVVDPELTLSLPPHLTAATGMDALTHAIEAYT
jgi:alcohol dehydrogenase